MRTHEEHRDIPQALSWALLILLTAGVVTWCMFIMMMVEDPPHQWDFGALPDVPGQSVYSTQPGTPPFDPKNPPRQMPKLPEAKRPAKIVQSSRLPAKDESNKEAHP
jgi:hypothetical protein